MKSFKHGTYNIIRYSYIIDLERVWQIIAPPTVHYSDHFL